MTDRYTKVLLTIIAACLLWLCVAGQLRPRITDVSIEGIGGQAVTWGGNLPVTVVADESARAEDGRF